MPRESSMQPALVQ